MSTPQFVTWGLGREPVIVGIDGSAGAQSALHEGVILAKALGRRLEAIVAWQRSTSMYDAYHPEPGTAPKVIALETASTAATAEFGEAWPSWFSTRAIEGGPAQVLVSASETASHLVVGSRGHNVLATAFLGSVSLHCASHSHCPVVVVGADARTAEDETPASPESVRAS